MSKKIIDFELDKETGCWNCTSHKIRSCGYPGVHRDGLAINMHRYIYIKYVDDNVDGFHIAHKCDNKRCINPDHLEKVLPIKNTRDAFLRGLVKTPKGEKSPHSKLSKEDALYIYNSEEKGSFLASKFSVSQQAICDIRKGRNWKHLTNKNNNKGVTKCPDQIHKSQTIQPNDILNGMELTAVSNITTKKQKRTYM